jgi:regulator of nucleoside diphosphate kinase
LHDAVKGFTRVAYLFVAAAGAGRISVTSPLGLALIGRKLGDIVKWNGPGGNETQATLKALMYQPEAAGDLLS